MDIVEEIINRLSSKVRIRSLFSDVSIESMEKMIERAQVVAEEKREAYAANQERTLQKQKQIEEIKEALQEKGLSLSDLGVSSVSADETTKKTRNVIKHNFIYEGPEGDLVEWHGSTMGRLPKDFQAYLEKTGSKRADCIVEE